MNWYVLTTLTVIFLISNTSFADQRTILYRLGENGETRSIECRSNADLFIVKEKIYLDTNLPPDSQFLSCNQDQINSEKSLQLFFEYQAVNPQEVLQVDSIPNQKIEKQNHNSTKSYFESFLEAISRVFTRS